MNEAAPAAVYVSSLMTLGAVARRVFPPPNAARALWRFAGYGGAGLFLLMLLHGRGNLDAIVLALLASALCVCAVIDGETGYIPDAVTFPVLAVEIGIAVASGRWESALQGAIACAAAIGLLYGVSRGRGIGLGDLKLAACIGAALGAAEGLSALGFAFVGGALHAGILLLLRRIAYKDAIHFAPYLAAGCVPVVFWQRGPWL